ncbi:MAG: hypothetical protein WC976_07255 [Caldisericia bacterium]
MERRTVSPRTMFEKRMAAVITWVIAITVLVVALTLVIALLVVFNKAEFGIGVKKAVWQSLQPFVYVLIGETLISIWLGRQVGIAVSKAISGPISRITNHLRRVVAGETKEQLSIRQGDDPGDLISLINRLIATVRG